MEFFCYISIYSIYFVGFLGFISVNNKYAIIIYADVAEKFPLLKKFFKKKTVVDTVEPWEIINCHARTVSTTVISLLLIIHKKEKFILWPWCCLWENKIYFSKIFSYFFYFFSWYSGPWLWVICAGKSEKVGARCQKWRYRGFLGWQNA